MQLICKFNSSKNQHYKHTGKVGIVPGLESAKTGTLFN
nr:MAG TPA: hypothetical protein [Bacteriophage sp.]